MKCRNCKIVAKANEKNCSKCGTPFYDMEVGFGSDFGEKRIEKEKELNRRKTIYCLFIIAIITLIFLFISLCN